jgi:predicted ATPase/DNA-binding SARP family transcriptional activator
MEPAWRIKMLGELRATHGDRVITRFRTRKTAALLAYLAFYSQRPHAREALIELLWPECRPERSRRSLRVALTSLRHQLEPPGVVSGSVLLADRDTVQLSPVGTITDVAQFEAALRSAMGSVPGGERTQRLAEAVERYQGELLPGCFEEWILPERQRLADAYLQALEQLIVSLEQSGNTHQSLQYAWRAVLAEPLCEEGHERLIRLLIAAGRPEAAVRQYQGLCERLKQEAGLVPTVELQGLVGELGAGQKDREAAAMVVTRTPAWLARMPHGPRPLSSDPHPPGGIDPASPAPLADALPAPRGFLPLSLTRFFGRETEVAELQRLLTKPQELSAHPDMDSGYPAGPRLVTLTGPGGSGKTRLALELGRRLWKPFDGAVWFVRLQELSNARLIPDELLKTLRLPHSTQHEPLDPIAAFLSRQPSLLILDNYEHLVAEGADVVAMLLKRTPTLTCLVTSRQRLEIEGERVFPVKPLPVPEEGIGCRVKGVESDKRDSTGPYPLHPTPYSLLQCASVQLFVDRAQAVRPDFQMTPANVEAVAALCQRLEGLPLALELAAARSGVLTPQQMLSHLERRFGLLVRRGGSADTRHQSLWAALDWSYQLLAPELQRFFRHLSVFRGGWTLAAAEETCQEPRALESLTELHAHSLVLAEVEGGEMRYRLLETLRQYSQERLTEAGEADAARVRHRDWFLNWAEQAEPELHGPNQAAWFNRFEAEHNNLRAALEWCKTEPGGVEAGLRLASALCGFWQVRSYWDERHRWLEEFLDRAEPTLDPAVRARALVSASDARNRLSVERVVTLASEGLALFQTMGDERGIAAALWELAGAASNQHDAGRAVVLWEEILTLYRKLGDQRGIAATLWILGWSAFWGSDLQRARSLAEESRALYRRLDNKQGIAEVNDLLWCIDWQQTRFDQAIHAGEEGLAAARELGYLQYVTHFLLQLGSVALQRGEYDRAASLCEESAAVARQTKFPYRILWALAHQGRAALYLGQHERAVRLCREGLEIAGPCGYADAAVAQCLEVLACETVQRRPERAVRLFSAAEALRRAYGEWVMSSCFDHPESASHLATARTALDEPAFTAAWAEGQAMTLQQAVEYALEETAAV